MSRRTHASVTEEACACNYLDTAADDPENPIVFDQRTGEYQFTYQVPECEGRSSLVIYHCPFCGGAAPESKRDLLFAVISSVEEDRLAEILVPIRSIKEAIDAFGKPDFDGFVSRRRREQDGAPPTRERHRRICYVHLSEVADVWVEERPDGEAHWHLQGKQLET